MTDDRGNSLRLTISGRDGAAPGSGSGEVEIDPEFLARYELGELLGRGGMGMVMKARQRDTGEELAVKFMIKAGDSTTVERFQREGRLLASVRHPSVVRVHEVGAMAGHPYLVCEFLSGGSLKERLAKRGPLSPADAVAVMGDVLAGLHACHLQGIVHRDLKPDNVMFDATGRPRLVDLGIAKSYAEAGGKLTQTGIVLGTPTYMSPEQARGDAAGLASDIYSAGVMLYELLCGVPPFVSAVVADVMHAHISKPVPALAERAPDAPAALCDAVHAALAKRIDERPGSAEDFAVRLRHSLEAREPRTTRPSAAIPVPTLTAPAVPRQTDTAPLAAATAPAPSDTVVTTPPPPRPRPAPAPQRITRRSARIAQPVAPEGHPLMWKLFAVAAALGALLAVVSVMVRSSFPSAHRPAQKDVVKPSSR